LIDIAGGVMPVSSNNMKKLKEPQYRSLQHLLPILQDKKGAGISKETEGTVKIDFKCKAGIDGTISFLRTFDIFLKALERTPEQTVFSFNLKKFKVTSSIISQLENNPNWERII
jgi:hypothetical protein